MTWPFFSHVRYRRLPILIAFVSVGLGGCAQPPARLSPEPILANVHREKLAQELQGKGELAEALIQWKILSTIDPDSTYYEKQVAGTKELIDDKSKSLMQDGVANLRRGAREAARLSFLKALALNPRNKEALEHLRQLTITSSSASQTSGKPEGTCCKKNTM